MDRLQLSTAVRRGLILLLALLPGLAWADEYCQISAEYNVRDVEMRLKNIELSGRKQVCVGSPIVRDYEKDGRLVPGTFRMVRTGSNEVALVSAAAVTVLGPVSGVQTFASAGKTSATQPSNDSGLGSNLMASGGNGGGPLVSTQFNAKPDFAIRADAKKASDEIALTSEQPVRVAVSGGKPIVENKYVKVELGETGKFGYVHQSGFTNLTEKLNPKKVTYSGGGSASPVSTGGTGAMTEVASTNTTTSAATGLGGGFIPPVKLPVGGNAPAGPSLVINEDVHKDAPTVAVVTGEESGGTPPAVKPEQQQPQSLTTNAAELQPVDTGGDGEMAQTDENLPVAVVPNVDSTVPAQGLTTVPLPMPLGGNQFFRKVPVKNWVRVTTAMNLRNEAGTRGASKVQMEIKEGGRLALVEMKTVRGEKWFKVVPFDCDKIEVRNNSGGTCDQAYWVIGTHLQGVTTPTAAEITSRMAWGQTEAAVACTECDPTAIQGLGDFSAIEDLSAHIEAAQAEGSFEPQVVSDEGLSVMDDYLAIRDAFMKSKPQIQKDFDWVHTLMKTRGKQKEAKAANLVVGAKYRAAFIKMIKEKLSAERASAVILALTAYGEARSDAVGGENQRMAEMSMVMQVINNRRAFEGNKNSALYYALKPWQFSVWNDAPNTDPNMFEMMDAGPGNKALIRAFTVQNLLSSGQIKPVGEIGKSATRHYYAPGATPDWMYNGHKVEAQFKMPDGSVMTVKSHKVRGGVA